MPSYYAIFTTLGLQRLAEAQAAYEPLVFTHVAVGDGNGSPITPDVSMTELVNETARVTVNSIDLSPDSPNTVRVEGLVPAATGGFTIREAGLFNGDGELIAVASYPPIYKPVPGDGVSIEEYIRILLEYEAVEAIALSTDPDVIVATRLYVDGLVHPIYFGDGSDGDVEFVAIGSMPEADFFTGTAPTYTLARDVYLNNLTLDAGVTLCTNGFRLFVKGTAYIAETARLHNDGEDSAGTAGGAGAPSGSLAGGAAGGAGAGALDGAGTAGTASALSGGGSGGAGGNSGAAGGAASDDPENGSIRSLLAVLYGYRFGAEAANPIRGGGGGGGGRRSGAGTARGGGGGAGLLCGAIRTLILEGSISVNGGAGSDGTSGAGGGGGGGGGFAGLAVGSKSGNGDITATGGAAGSGGTPVAGSDGTVVLYDLGLPRVEDSTLLHYEGGVAIFTATDTVSVTFPDSWAYATATGAGGYELDVSVPYVPAGTDIRVVISAKTTTGFTLKGSASFTGEVRWRAKGV